MKWLKYLAAAHLLTTNNNFLLKQIGWIVLGGLILLAVTCQSITAPFRQEEIAAEQAQNERAARCDALRKYTQAAYIARYNGDTPEVVQAAIQSWAKQHPEQLPIAIKAAFSAPMERKESSEKAKRYERYNQAVEFSEHMQANCLQGDNG